MKVALAFPGCHKRGGVERVVYETAKYLAQHENNVTVFANSWEQTADNHPNLNFVHVPFTRLPGYASRASFLTNATRIMRAYPDFDVVNTHGVICPYNGVLRVHSLHRDWLAQSKTFNSRGPVQRAKHKLNPMHVILRYLENRHFRGRRYKHLIVLTEHIRTCLTNYYGVPQSDITVVPNGFDSIEFNPEIRLRRRSQMRSQFGYKDSDLVLLFVANELDRKGYYPLVKSLAKLEAPSVKLLVVGRVDETLVMNAAESCGVREQVTFHGPTGDVAGMHAAADVFVLPTKYEAYCLAILEALGSGLPVITSAVPGAMDPIIPGKNGSLIMDPNDSSELSRVVTTYLDRNFRMTATEFASNSVAHLAWDHVLSDYMAVLAKHQSH